MSKLNATVSAASADGYTADFSNTKPISFLLGPCAMESRDHAMMMATKIKDITERVGVKAVYKTSFDKANRTSTKGYRGPNLGEALRVFEDVRTQVGLPVVTDIHLPQQCKELGEVVDILQIPAFLCRQTDLLKAAAKTDCIINVKKGQFLAPWDMQHVVNKLIDFGAKNVMVTERGASFGYNTLISDMRSIPELRATGAPVIFDATHSVQQPGGQGASSGGQRKYAPVLARAAVAVGLAGVFMETHQDPDTAPSDGPNMIPLDTLENVLHTLKSFDEVCKSAGLTL